MNELVIISGKGGTGKTSVTASLAVLAAASLGPVVVADCDVDAADLHLVLSPRVLERHPFYGGHVAVIRPDDCAGCGECLAQCRFGAVVNKDASTYVVDPAACEGCGVCVRFCPVQAIDFPLRHCGEWMTAETRCGPMVHAQLGIASENSGKLVATVRREARRIAEEERRELILVDGPPGIGCPVISSVTGASLALVVTEPTVSGEHDLERVLLLLRHFQVLALVCVNKWDLNPEMTARIEEKARQAGARVAGRIRYDRAVTQAQLREQAVVEYQDFQDGGCAQDMRDIWNRVSAALAGHFTSETTGAVQDQNPIKPSERQG